MAHDPVFEAKHRILNRFALTVITIERSKQLIRGARTRTEAKHSSVVCTALAEIAEGVISPPDESGNCTLDLDTGVALPPPSLDDDRPEHLSDPI